jgi:hypothetical protein
MLVHVSDPSALRGLIACLGRAGCACTRIGSASFEVLHPPSFDEDEERMELAFFLRAWAAQHPDVLLSFG